MKQLVAIVALFGLVAAASAQERIPREEAQQIAKLLVETADKADYLPLKAEVDAEKPFGIRKDNYGMMVIPDKRLSEESFAKAGSEATPVGHMWFRNLAPAKDGRVTPNNKLRILTLNFDGQDFLLPFCILAVRKGNNGPELLFLGKDKEPLVVLPLTKIDAGQELPVELEAKKGETEGTGLITLNLLGKYQATLTVMEQEP